MTYARGTVRPFYHGTRADLSPGDLIAPGYSSNYGQRKQASWVYLTGTLDAAIWAAELAIGDGRSTDTARRPSLRPTCIRLAPLAASF